jgi:WD40 repeat protein
MGVVFSPDGRYVLLGGDDRKARLWDVASGHPVGDLVGQGAPLDDMTFSAAGRAPSSGHATSAS